MPSNVRQLLENGTPIYPITERSLVIGLQDAPFEYYVVAWDGASTPVVANIPAGVVVTYNNVNYTGTLAAGSATAPYLYLVASTTQAGEYDRYIVTNNGNNTFSWTPVGSTAPLTPVIVDNLTTNDATKALSAKQGKALKDELSQFEAEVTDLTTEEVPAMLYENVPIQQVQYELGNITINIAGWTYSDSNKRVRTPQGFDLHLFPGDVIGLTDYTDARFYIGCRNLQGTYTMAGWLTADFTAEQEGYYCILVCNLVDTTQSSAEALGSLIRVKRNTSLNAVISALDGVSYDHNLQLYENNKCINNRGVLADYTNAAVYSCQVKRGDFVRVVSSLSATYVAIAGETTTAEKFNVLLNGGGGNPVSYICEREETLYVAVYPNNAFSIVHAKNEQYRALIDSNWIKYYDDITGLAKDVANTYIRYSDGALMTTGSNIHTYHYPCIEGQKVRCFVTGSDQGANAISFYNSDTVSDSTYISGVRMLLNGSGGRWYETVVPANAKKVVFTCHLNYCPIPIFRTDRGAWVVNEILKKQSEELSQMEKLGIGIVFGYQKIDNVSGEFNPAYTLNSYFPIQSVQEKIRGTALYGIRVNFLTAGTLTVVKATGVNTSDCQMTTIKVFSVEKTGWQVLLFDSPVKLSNVESIGIGVATDTGRLVSDTANTTENIKMDYLHYTANEWRTYNANTLVDFLGVPASVGEVLGRVDSLEKTNAFAGANPFRFRGPFYAHLFINKIYQDSTNIVIPSESLEDIRVARRLGFDVIEANVHQTSEGKYIVIHGASGTFGYEVTDLNGDFTYADTAINSVSLDWIKANIRYRSDIPRYRTTIPTLEEFLRECRLQGMIPFAQANTAEMVELLDGIMGYGNYLAYNGTRALTSAPIVEYKSLTTKAEILERARSFGVPYIYAMGNVDSFTDEELADIVASLHKEGYMIATAYRSGMAALKCRKFGFDLIASTWEVNDFDNANLCTLSSGFNWDDFQINSGTIENDGLHLLVGQNIRPATIPGTVFLGKAQIQVTFVGELYIECGNDYATVTSDGKNPVVFSSYFINTAPTFYISGQGDGAVITDLVFKASKC